jgi:hypothetical protein
MIVLRKLKKKIQSSTSRLAKKIFKKVELTLKPSETVLIQKTKLNSSKKIRTNKTKSF